MQRKAMLAVVMAAALTGCVSTPRTVHSPALLHPSEAIERAAAAAPDGVPGVFVIEVKGMGARDGYGYLNSETDYRDQRCLTIEIAPGAFARMAGESPGSPLARYRGRRVEVRGTAVRTRIDFIVGGRPSGKYYYQTHVLVTDPAQIVVVDGV